MLVRQILNITSCTLGGCFAVHELIHEGAQPSCGCSAEELHTNEAVGKDLAVDFDGTWKNIIRQAEGSAESNKGKTSQSWSEEWEVDVGPIDHRGEHAESQVGHCQSSDLVTQCLAQATFYASHRSTSRLIPSALFPS